MFKDIFNVFMSGRWTAVTVNKTITFIFSFSFFFYFFLFLHLGRELILEFIFI